MGLSESEAMVSSHTYSPGVETDPWRGHAKAVGGEG